MLLTKRRLFIKYLSLASPWTVEQKKQCLDSALLLNKYSYEAVGGMELPASWQDANIVHSPIDEIKVGTAPINIQINES